LAFRLKQLAIGNCKWAIGKTHPLPRGGTDLISVTALGSPSVLTPCDLRTLNLLNFPHQNKRGLRNMANEKKQPTVDNIISDETGAFDLRFILWRHFCQQNNIPVETLPSQLDGDQKEKWEELKASRLRGK
jgi:hypothetical protein